MDMEEPVGTTQQRDASSMMQPGKILVIQPDGRAPLGRFSDWLADYGAEVTVIQPFAGDQISADVAADGLIVLGGTMHFDDVEHFPWLEDISALYRQAAAANIPTLGICLGAQLLADTFGGKVTVKSSEGPETGVVEIAQTADGANDPSMEGLPDSFRATAFHYDGITELPAGSVLLGTGERYPNQIFRYGHAVGLQFHPEATPELFQNWCAGDSASQPELTGFFDEQRRELQTADDEIAAQVYKFAQNFVRQLQTAPQMQRS